MAKEKTKVIKIDPQLDSAGARKLNNDVKNTFKAGTSQIETGLSNTIKSLGSAFVASFAFDKIIAGFQEVAASATETTKTVAQWADDLATNAKVFQTTPTQLARLLTTGGGAGLTDEQVYNAINRVSDYLTTQREMGNAYAKKYSENPVEAFIQYANAIKNETDVAKRNASLNEVFGKRQALTYADFLISPWAEFSNIKFTDNFDAEVERLADLNGVADRVRSDARHLDIWRNMLITDEGRLTQIQKDYQTELDQAYDKNVAATDGVYEANRFWDEMGHAMNPAVMASVFTNPDAFNEKVLRNIARENPEMADKMAEKWGVKQWDRQRPMPVEIISPKAREYEADKRARQNAKGVNE